MPVPLLSADISDEGDGVCRDKGGGHSPLRWLGSTNLFGTCTVLVRCLWGYLWGVFRGLHFSKVILCAFQHILKQIGGAGKELTVGEKPDGVGERFGKGNVVGGEEDGFAVFVGEAVQQLKDLALAGIVEEGGGLVEHQRDGLLREGLGNHHFLLFAVAQGFKRTVGEGFDADELQGLGDDATVFLVQSAPEIGVGRATEADDFRCRKVAQVGSLGEDESHR